MRYQPDIFDMLNATDAVADLAPRLLDDVRQQLEPHFVVTELKARTTIVDTGGQAIAIRWAADCMDTLEGRRRVTGQPVTVHGISIVEPLGNSVTPESQRVTHCIDWAGVYGQLGMSVSRPIAYDPSRPDG